MVRPSCASGATRRAPAACHDNHPRLTPGNTGFLPSLGEREQASPFGRYESRLKNKVASNNRLVQHEDVVAAARPQSQTGPAVYQPTHGPVRSADLKRTRHAPESVLTSRAPTLQSCAERSMECGTEINTDDGPRRFQADLTNRPAWSSAKRRKGRIGTVGWFPLVTPSAKQNSYQ